MAEILVKVTSWLSLLPRISVGNILEIVIISFLVYELLVWIKNTRAWNLLKGLLVILVFVLFFAKIPSCAARNGVFLPFLCIIYYGLAEG